MYGKHFSAMYCGSMVGAGFAAYSLMGYVIANMKPDKTVGFQVELNTKLLAAVFGEPEAEIEGAIEYLCAVDPKSRTEAEEGRRIVKVGAFAYRVVNGVHYDKLRNEEDRREQNRIAQAKFRSKKNTRKKSSSSSTQLPGDYEFQSALKRGASQEELDEIQTRNLPESCR